MNKKCADSANQNKDVTVLKDVTSEVENKNETAKETENKESESDRKIKKVQFQFVATVDKEELSENLHIDIDDNADELNTGMLNSALDINSSADTDILDDNEHKIPCSQIPRKSIN